MRLFVSIRPSADAVAHLAAALDGRPTSNPDQWHVTLAFLGELPAAEPLFGALTAAAAQHPPFSLRLAGGGRFRRSPTWAGVAGDVAVLRALAADVQDACRAAGVELERRAYRPHLTVGRVDPRLLAGYDGPSWQVAEVELVHSVLGKHAVHTVLERFPLAAHPPVASG